MKQLNRLFSALNIRSGEERLVGLLLVYAFFMGLPALPVETASYTLFLVAFDAQSIPYVYIGFAVVTTLSGLIYTKAEERYSFGLVMTGNLLLLTLSLFFFRLLLELTDSRWPAMALTIWYNSSWALANLGFWSLATHLLNVQQGKRLFALIGVGLTLSETLVGFAIPTLVSWVGTVNLILISAVSFAVALVIQSYILRAFADQLVTSKLSVDNDDEAGDKTEATGSIRRLFNNRYIKLIFIFATLYILSYYLLDNAFYAQADAQFPVADELASFLGLFFAGSGLLTMIGGMFVSGQLIHHYGVRFGLLTMPITILVGAIIIAVSGSMMQSVTLLFVVVAATKFVNEIVAYTINRAAWQVLYEPLPAGIRLQTQTVVESMVKPIAGGLAGLLLLLLGHFFEFGATQIAYLLIIILATWIGVVILLDRLYLTVLLEVLTQQRFRKKAAPIEPSQSNVTALKNGLTSSHVGVVVYSLNLLEEFEPESLALFLQGLLAHPTTEIRLEALTRIERWRLPETVPAIRVMLQTEKEDAVRGTSLRVLAILGGPELFSEVSAYMEHPSPKIRLGAIVGLLNNQQLDKTYITTIRKKLITLAQSEQSSERIFVAQVIGEAGIYTFNRLLLKLLRDDQTAVCRAALDAAKQINHPDLWSVVIEHLATPKLRAKAVSALVVGNRHEVLPAIKVAFYQANQSPTTLVYLAQVCGRLGGNESIKLLLDQLIVSDERVKHQVLQALNQCGYQATGDDQLLVEQKIKTEVAWATWTLASLVDLGDDESVSLLKTALHGNLARHRERVLYWLSFRYNPGSIRKVQNSLELFNLSRHGSSSEQGAYALEVIEILVSSTSTNLKPILLPLLDSQLTPQQCLQALSSYFPQQQLSHEQRLETMIVGGGAWLNQWTKACAIYTASHLSLTELAEIIAIALASPHSLVQDSALWALFNLDKPLYYTQVQQLPPTLPQQISNSIRWLGQPSDRGTWMLSLIEKVILLKAVHVFAETPEDVLVEVASLLTELQIEAGQVIFEKGKPGSSLYIIVNGRVKIHDGDQLFDRLDVGDVFGELALLDSQPRSASVTTLNEVRLLRLNQRSFYELVSERSEVAQGIIRVLVQRLRGLNKKLVADNNDYL
ncbi:cyclic nucleotide-binding domain-containing protein [Anaerolineales bacterium HSG6]|nr:cyclic nucleotide-binding domain-containing protein [Anaerolineales bacterium HSG6]